MRIEILDQINAANPDNGYSEDDLTVLNGEENAHALLLDGATPVNDAPIIKDNPYHTDAQWYVKTFITAFQDAVQEQNQVFDGPNALKTHIFPFMYDSFVHASSIKPETLKGRDIPCGSGVIACVTGRRLILTGIGDCRYIIKQNGTRDGHDLVHNMEHPDEDPETKYSQERQKQAEEQGGEFSLNDATMRKAYQEHRDQVNTFGQGQVFSLDDSSLKYAWCKVVRLSTINPTEILLMSDGLSRLYEVYQTHTPDAMFTQAKERGLESLIEDLRSFENDPDNPIARIKRYDDAAALLLQINT